MFGVTGVSCALGNSGFSINGKFGSCNDTPRICSCIDAIALAAVSNGLTAPMLAAFSAKALLISGDILIGLKIFFLRLIKTTYLE